jgi:hypothetical protein
MTLPVRPYPEPAIRESYSGRATVRRAPPAVLLQLSRDEGVEVVVGIPMIERDPSLDNRPTAPAPFWVARVDEPTLLPPLRSIEPEPRRTTPSMVRMRRRHSLLAMAFAAVIVASGVGAAKILAQADTAAMAR